MSEFVLGGTGYVSTDEIKQKGITKSIIYFIIRFVFYTTLLILLHLFSNHIRG